MKYVWVIVDEKYGPTGVYATKRAAKKALEDDERHDLAPSGYSPAVCRMGIRE